MGPLIHLATPTHAGVDAARLDYSVGRSLTAADFALQDRYVDARLLSLTPATTGVITGLGISPARFDSPNGSAGVNSFTWRRFGPRRRRPAGACHHPDHNRVG
jgi:hypothetical protein